MPQPTNGAAEAIRECRNHLQRIGFCPSVLIVDDNSNDRELWEEQLGLLKVNINHARSGKEGIQMIKSQHYDLVLLDLWLGDMSGVNLLKEVAHLSYFVVITGDAESTTAIEATQAGAFYAFQKSTDENQTAIQLVAIFGTLVALTRRHTGPRPKWFTKVLQKIPTAVRFAKWVHGMIK